MILRTDFELYLYVKDFNEAADVLTQNKWLPFSQDSVGLSLDILLFDFNLLSRAVYVKLCASKGMRTYRDGCITLEKRSNYCNSLGPFTSSSDTLRTILWGHKHAQNNIQQIFRKRVILKEIKLRSHTLRNQIIWFIFDFTCIPNCLSITLKNWLKISMREWLNINSEQNWLINEMVYCDEKCELELKKADIW